MKTVCLVAILRDEIKFLDEWLCYHKLIGIDHFFVYDNDPDNILIDFLRPHESYVTVIPWTDIDPISNSQLGAYTHAVNTFIENFKWTIFLDGDEFIVLPKRDNLIGFLSSYDDKAAVSLSWYVFGHNGYWNDPEALITTSLTRRCKNVSKLVKTFTRSDKILSINSAHYCDLTEGKRLIISPEIAHINHYHCRSFTRWIGRVARGDSFYNIDNSSKANLWRFSEKETLKKFVRTVAYKENEFFDDYMEKFKDELIMMTSLIKKMRIESVI